jgi:hypothetical protein
MGLASGAIEQQHRRASTRRARAPTRRPHWAEREKASELARRGADRMGPHGGESGEGEKRARGPLLIGGGRLSARARALLGRLGLTWAEMVFSFFLEFLIVFLFYFL